MYGDAVSKRLYRQDAMAQEDWSLVCSRLAPSRPVVVDDETGEEALRTEYLVSAAPLNEHYTITTPTRTAQPDGTVVNTKTRTSFLLLDSAHGNHRPHQMPTADLADQVVAKSPLALLVVRLQLNRVVKGAAGASSDVFDMAEIEDPEWVTPNDLAGAGANWYTALATWQAGGSDQGGCVALTSPKPVQNLVPLLSPQCPTYCLQVALRRKGYLDADKKCDHRVLAPGEFDCFPATKMKPYLQCLVSLPKTLPLTSHMPSRQPMRYYRLLLAGKKGRARAWR